MKVWKEIEKEIEKDGIKVKVRWEPEMTQDLRFYGIDAEAELTKILNEEISRELKKRWGRIPTVTGKIQKIKI